MQQTNTYVALIVQCVGDAAIGHKRQFPNFHGTYSLAEGEQTVNKQVCMLINSVKPHTDER